jgi:hypothetical protein
MRKSKKKKYHKQKIQSNEKNVRLLFLRKKILRKKLKSKEKNL